MNATKVIISTFQLHTYPCTSVHLTCPFLILPATGKSSSRKTSHTPMNATKVIISTDNPHYPRTSVHLTCPFLILPATGKSSSRKTSHTPMDATKVIISTYHPHYPRTSVHLTCRNFSRGPFKCVIIQQSLLAFSGILGSRRLADGTLS